MLRDGQARAALGATGSERLASAIFQVLLRLRRQSPFEAVHAPRLHCTPEDLVLLEAERVPTATLEALGKRRFVVEALEPYSFRVGGLQLVVREDRGFCGVADPRRDGSAGGPEK